MVRKVKRFDAAQEQPGAQENPQGTRGDDRRDDDHRADAQSGNHQDDSQSFKHAGKQKRARSTAGSRPVALLLSWAKRHS